jgi:hypothetical protein
VDAEAERTVDAPNTRRSSGEALIAQLATQYVESDSEYST